MSDADRANFLIQAQNYYGRKKEKKKIETEFDKIDRVIGSMEEQGWLFDPSDSYVHLVFERDKEDE